ncbi:MULTISPECIES: VWA domain-containing protein [Pseudomonas]|uniref:VWA domain-containing protein n=1 Tax=Pseudomonas TaxID=286 RepID=UPI002096BE04|nr:MULTISPECIES: VWA domain-containing protein [Pseudomonas]MCO7577115.1 VWA domain-containing protein [Pseudomonas protegens]MCO7583490.1 VWA domain-containing protein [Pseudomonas chlororaphis]MCO7600376.1 VWA domain-containing protein [Pseudomonas chlororaphis]MDC7814466.1 VWA domain-containing protein [Pseudomonas sp. BLCC-B112]
MQITQGQRLPLSSIGISDHLTVSVSIQSSNVIDVACFGLDQQSKLSDDRFMVFFNQTTAPADAIRLIGPGQFEINLSALPATIDRLVFTAAIDGSGAMKDISSSRFVVSGPGAPSAATCEFAGGTFTVEKAIMVVDIYRKGGEWRMLANLQGFKEGLSALVRHFGGEVSDEAPAPAAPPLVQASFSLEKKVAAQAPALLSLAKKAQISLEKNNLTKVRAKLAFVLDVSGSMNGQYSRGRVQEAMNRLMPLAVAFDDDGELDMFGFGAKPVQLSPATLSNYSDYIDTEQGGWRKWDVGQRINDEPKAMRMVMDFYNRSGGSEPVYIIFLSDGGVHKNREITQLMMEASGRPFFWQFVGLGGHGYGILERLDDMAGRVVDNCSFFAVDDLHDLTEDALYDKLMKEFPGWLKEAKAKGIISS